MFTVSPKDPALLGSMFAFQLPNDILNNPELALLSNNLEFDEHNTSAMKLQFENPRLFRGKRDNDTWGISDSYVEAPEPLCDVFYLLQCILPGILTITREEDPDDMPEFINARGLPRQRWLERHKTLLETIFDERGFEEIWEAAGDRKKAYVCSRVPRQLGGMAPDGREWMQRFA